MSAVVAALIPLLLGPAPHCRPSAEWLEARGDERPAADDSIVSETYPIRVHYSEGWEVRAAAALEAAETAWAVQVDQLGFAPPVLPDDAAGPELDIYLAELAPWEGWAWAPDQTDTDPTDGRSAAPAYVAFDRDVPVDWLAPYVVHEFNHVLQYAYDFNEAAITPWEATAVAAQKWTLGDVASYWDADVGDFQAVPWAPVLVGDSYELLDRYGIDGYYEYGAGLWMVALDEAFGDGHGSIGPALWEATAQEGDVNEPDFVDAVAEATGSLADAMDAIAEARHAWGDLLFEDRLMIGGQAFLRDVAVEEVDAPSVSSVVAIGDDVAVSWLGPGGWDGDDDPWVEGTVDLREEDEDDDLDSTGNPAFVGVDEQAACACSSSGPGGAFLGLYLALSAARRRHSRCSSTLCPPTGEPSSTP